MQFSKTLNDFLHTWRVLSYSWVTSCMELTINLRVRRYFSEFAAFDRVAFDRQKILLEIFRISKYFRMTSFPAFSKLFYSLSFTKFVFCLFNNSIYTQRLQRKSSTSIVLNFSLFQVIKNSIIYSFAPLKRYCINLAALSL